MNFLEGYVPSSFSSQRKVLKYRLYTRNIYRNNVVASQGMSFKGYTSEVPLPGLAPITGHAILLPKRDEF